MRRFRFLLLALYLGGGAASARELPPAPPDQLLAPLFQQVQRAQLFADQKTFADAVPRHPPADLLAHWQQAQLQPGYSLRGFVNDAFDLPAPPPAYTPPAGATLRAHIEGLWPVLTRAGHTGTQGSLLPLPHPYVVPGGRFAEMYYWDSYFTLLGLAASGRWEVVTSMVDNFAWQLDQYGHIPNGNRSYYLSRSQPPFFSLMVEVLATHKGDAVYSRYLPQLRAEYTFWMDGSEALAPGDAYRRVVRLADGAVLNRYWDARAVPRTESWSDDLATAALAPQREASEVYRDLRAGAESGWDFSSRWLDDPARLSSIRTTDIIPVDLNSLLYHLEQTLARASRLAGAAGDARRYSQRAQARRSAIHAHLWDDAQGWYTDQDMRDQTLRPALTAAALYPLWLGVATPSQARHTAAGVERQLLRAGGLLTTTVTTGQQWDAPNGWAPLQWVAVDGLQRYGQHRLARQLGVRFLRTVQSVYEAEGKLVEKYVVDGPATGGGGGEYPLQDGFGWTNGVTMALLDRLCPPRRLCEDAGDVEAP